MKKKDKNNYPTFSNRKSIEIEISSVQIREIHKQKNE